MSQLAFPEIQKSFDEKNWNSIILYCQDLELRVCIISGFTTPHIYKISTKNNARFLWKRIPSELKAAKPYLKDIWFTIQNLSQFDCPAIYKCLTLNYPPEITPFINAVKESFQIRTFELISNAYSTISIKDCSTFLGTTPEETVKYTISKGWELDQPSNTLKPVPIKVDKLAKKNGNSQIRSLTDYVLFLEKP
eukprot:gene1179-1491_t